MSKSEAITVRTFLAVEIPSDLRERLAAVESELTSVRRFLRWVSPPLLHITIRFLGDVPEIRLPLVEAAAREAAAGCPPFSLTLAGCGAFPNPRTPRVVWVGLQGGTGLTALRQLSSHLEHGLRSRDFGPDNRAFSPHVTLARIRSDASVEDRRRVGEALVRVIASTSINETFEVPEIIVMRSDLGQGGPTYTPLARAALGSGTIG